MWCCKQEIQWVVLLQLLGLLQNPDTSSRHYMNKKVARLYGGDSRHHGEKILHDSDQSFAVLCLQVLAQLLG